MPPSGHRASPSPLRAVAPAIPPYKIDRPPDLMGDNIRADLAARLEAQKRAALM
jgi:hypothetical protein